jgi:phospholipase C
MLGYLSLLGGRLDVDGLKDSMSNACQGQTYKIHPLAATHDPKQWNPCHTVKRVAEQMQNGNGGFVANFAAEQAASDGNAPVDLVMGYYRPADVSSPFARLKCRGHPLANPICSSYRRHRASTKG